MNTLPAIVAAGALPAVRQADSDRELITTWLARHESRHTRDNYGRHAKRFLEAIGKPLLEVRVGDVQAFLAGLEGRALATRANTAAAIKSLLSFGHDIGYLPLNVGKVVKAPAVKNTLAERIMSEADATRLIALVRDPRNRALLTLTYGAGLRASEVCALRWRDVTERDGAGQVTVFGKGGKTRAILLSASTWKLLADLRADNFGATCAEIPAGDFPVFRSRKGGMLSRQQLHRIVKAAAAEAGISPAVSAHWLRHAHASHSLDRGAPIHLVQATLGHASVATTGRYTHARPTDSSARYLGV